MALYGKVPSNLALRQEIEIPQTKRLGLGWPIGVLPREGYFNKSSSIALIQSQITQLIRTRRGERPMLPNYGTSLEDYLFQPLTSTLASKIADDIKFAIARYASNVELLSVRVFADDNIKGYGMPGILINLTVRPFDGNQSIDVGIVI